MVGFSVKFDNQGEYANRSDGMNLPAIKGKELYVNPASSPATNAPDTIPLQIKLRGYSFEYNLYAQE